MIENRGEWYQRTINIQLNPFNSFAENQFTHCVCCCFSFLYNFRKKSAKIKSAYKQDYFHGTADVDFDFAGPAVQASAVVGYEPK